MHSREVRISFLDSAFYETGELDDDCMLALWKGQVLE